MVIMDIWQVNHCQKKEASRFEVKQVPSNTPIDKQKLMQSIVHNTC